MKRMYGLLFIATFFCHVFIGVQAGELAQLAKQEKWHSVKKLVLSDKEVAEDTHELGVALGWAAFHDNAKMLSLLLRKGADVNAVDREAKPCWLQPIHRAIEGRAVDALVFLESVGTDFAQVQSNGATLLHFAAMKGDLSSVQYLVEEKHLEVNARTKSGRTPLHRVCSLEIARYLVEQGAEVNAADNRGNRPITFAQSLGFVRFFVSSNAEIDFADRDGTTLLHRAVMKGNLPILRFLLKMDLDPYIKNNAGTTPLHLIFSQGTWLKKHEKIALRLLAEGLNINEQDAKGLTLLHRAVLYRMPKAVKFLLKQGADRTIRSPQGETACDLLDDFDEEVRELLE